MEQGHCRMGLGTPLRPPRCTEGPFASPCPRRRSETLQQDPGHEGETATLSTAACRESGLALARLRPPPRETRGAGLRG